MTTNESDAGAGQASTPPAVSVSPPPLPPTVLQYVTPVGAAVGEGVWREGNKLVTTVRATLPPNCVKCNAPADGMYASRKYHWQPPSIAMLIGVLSLIFRKRADVVVGLCATHRRKRITRITIASILAPLGFVVLLLGISFGSAHRSDEWMILAGLVVGMGMMIIALIAGITARILSPTKIDSQYAWFKGCGAEFLAQLPPTR